MSKILEILDPMDEVDVKDYIWKDCMGNSIAREHAASRARVGPVKLVGTTWKNPDLGWGCHFDEAVEALLFNDGTILALVSVSEFVGTDHSNEMRLRMFILTPKFK